LYFIVGDEAIGSCAKKKVFLSSLLVIRAAPMYYINKPVQRAHSFLA
jgi:hypothetical protein